MQLTKIAITLVLAVPSIVGVSACASTRMAGEETDDMRITGRVGRRLTADPDVSRYKIDVDTLEGVVTLRGKVDSETMKTSAERIAMNTDGVKRVVNELVVEPEKEGTGKAMGEAADDMGIRTRVGSKFTMDPDIKRFDIDIDVDDGVVTLSGIVRDEKMKAEAERVAREVEGVKDVKNELKVAPEEKKMEGEMPPPEGTSPEGSPPPSGTPPR